MIHTHKYRLYPNIEQKSLLAKHFGHTRWVYNWGLGEKKKAYETAAKSLSYVDLAKMLTLVKKEDGKEWLSEVSAQSLQQALMHLDTAYKNFFEGRADFPTLKSKHSSKQSFTVAQYVDVDWGTRSIKLQKFDGPIKFKVSRRFPGDPRKCTVTKNASGEYHISICFETPDVVPEKPHLVSREDVLGIDVGIKDFAITSEGEVVKNNRYTKRFEKRLALLQQRHSHKKKGSHNRKKAQLAVARCHQKIVDQRGDFLHKLSTRLVSENKAIARESLNVAGMIRNHKLSKAVSDASWSTFDAMLKYKAELGGKWFLQIGRFEASSKTCHVCSYVKRDMTLSDRSWVCPTCKTVHDRDVNAAFNIRNWAWVAWVQKKQLPLGEGEVMPVSRKRKLPDGVKAEGTGARGSSHGAGINRESSVC